MPCVLLLALLARGFPSSAAGEQVGLARDGYQVISLVNQLRAANGLPEYQINSALMAAAQAHSDYQASIGSVTHTGAGGSRPADRAAAAGYGGGARVFISENIYGGRNASPQQAVTWWQGDAPHLNTMLSGNYVDVGAGVAVGSNGVVYYTLDAGYTSGSSGSGATQPASGGTTVSRPPATSGPTAIVIIPVRASTPRPDGSIVHVVQQGQALWNIAALYEVSIPDLLALNNLGGNAIIHPGDKILVRPAAAPAGSLTPGEATPGSETSATPSAPAPTGNAESDTPTVTAPATIPTSSTEVPTTTPTPTVTTAAPAEAQANTDPVLVGIILLVVLGTTLVLAGSMFRRG